MKDHHERKKPTDWQDNVYPTEHVRLQLIALERITEQLTRIADSLETMISKQA